MSHRPLFTRLFSSIRKRLARLLWTGGFRVVAAEGVLLLLDYRNFVDRQIYLFGSYEGDRIAYFLKHMANMRCDVFMDIGANFGLYSILVADRLNIPEILAFEP